MPRQQTLIGAIPLPSCVSLDSCLSWSSLGQALVVTEDILFVISFLLGLHPNLATLDRLCDLATNPDWQGKFPHASAQIHIKTVLEADTATRERRTVEADYSDSHPLFAGTRWKSASWSKAGMGPNGSCLLIAITSELDLYVIGPPTNSWTGNWVLLHSVDMSAVCNSIVGHSGDVASLVHPYITQYQSGQDQDRKLFADSRILVRKRQRATEVLCASWLDPGAQICHSVTCSDDSPDVTSSYIVAGLRAGYVAVWSCQALTGHCVLASVVQLSEWGIDRLLLREPDSSSDGSVRRLAFQDVDGIHLGSIQLNQNGCSVTGTPPSRVPMFGNHTVSHWNWFEHRLVYATVGKVHVYDSLSGTSSAYVLGLDPTLTSDPYAPVISIVGDSSAKEVTVILQDLHEYRIPIRIIQSETITLIPTAPSVSTGYAPLTAQLQRQYDSLQNHHGFETEPVSKESTCLAGVVLMDEGLASFGFKVSETSKYHLLLIQEADASVSTILSDTLSKVVSGLSFGQPPVVALGAVMTAFQISADKKATATSLERSIVETTNRLSTQSQQTLQQDRALILAQQQALFVLSIWLQRQSDVEMRALDSLVAQHQERVTAMWIERWLSSFTKAEHDATLQAEQNVVLRFLLAYQLLPRSVQTSRMPKVQAAADQVLRKSKHEVQDIRQTCAACSAETILSWSDDLHSFAHAACSNNHIWPRCSVTLAPIFVHQVRVCTTCWAKSLIPGDSGLGSTENAMLEQTSRCPACGSCWVVT